MSTRKPREFFISFNGVNCDDRTLSVSRKRPSGISGGGMMQTIKVREVLPGELTPEEVFFRILNFLIIEGSSEKPSVRSSIKWAEWLESKRDEILGGKE